MRVVAVSLAALAVAAAGGSAAPSLPVTGLHGVVTRGPTQPVCRESEPCEEPAAGVVLDFRRGGVLVARVRTGPAGRYRARLRPGWYAVRTPTRGRLPRLSPQAVRVRTGPPARVDFHLDTGIQ